MAAPRLFPPNLVDIAGGKQNVLALAHHFYNELSFKDPIMAPLYHDKTLPHHERFSLWFFNAVGVTDQYDKEGGMALLLKKHDESKHCPLRDQCQDPRAGHTGGPFTKAQRNRWLKYQLDACAHFNLPREFVEPYIHGLTVFLNAYGPWVDARGGLNDGCPVSKVSKSSSSNHMGDASPSGASVKSVSKGIRKRSNSASKREKN